MKEHFKEYFKLLKFAKGQKFWLFLAIVCMGITTLFEGVSLGLIIPVSDRVLTNKKIVIPGELPDFLSNFIDKLNSIEPVLFLKIIVISIPLIFLIKGIFTFLQNYFMNIVGQGVIYEVRNRLFDKFHQLSMNFYARKRMGELMSRITNDVGTITNAISYALKDLLFESMKVVVFAVLAFYIGFKISWKLPLVAFVLFPLIMFPVIRLGKRIKKFTKTMQEKMADLNSLMADTIGGMYIVKAFSRQNHEMRRFRDINYGYYKFTLKAIKREITISPLTEFTATIGVVFVLWVVGNEVISGRVSFGIFGAFMAYLMSMIRPFKKLSNVYAINQKALAASARIYEILEETPQIEEKKGAEEIKEIKNSIEFKNVWFRYSPDDENVLKNINLKIKKGDVVALVGPSGAGKTTLVNLLPRFYDPEKGVVKIDQKDIKDFKIEPLRRLISIVSQQTVLFHSSVGENIAYGKEGASKEEIAEAAKKAHAYEFIEKFPYKFDTIVGDRGVKLSGGQKQRISIARAILKNAPILILDEATSQLDSVSEKFIKEALALLMRGKTTFVIAHRLSTVEEADLIVVLDNGEIVETGTHKSLIASDTAYKRLYQLQFNI
ncbi:MAG: ABC transporter ATP-binding protein/permease [Candidatus Omnitrophica bacterium]|nr:ABC transporter ATP-binding protein/permease [Candidatus Omnitrophota bacterium]MCF7877129.1 ABC transporter ATP-binding protein/permease [Candidatus Omnitrophota bacterium]MCF7878730.1 ABC transporter ATP-binding protein/permease [Candidatus Omnitrophota bacterium]MCF7892797.1 ABC transporter ATP-binding protein/permease [Candidatus Omnitrophota bacterium]